MRSSLSGGIWFVNGESVVAVFRKTCSQRNCSERLRISAPGQQPGFAENLEPVADAQHQPAIGGKLLHGLHHRAEPRDGAVRR